MAATTPTLFAFLGLWGTLAVGAAAVSIPIIIHLLNRRRFRIVVWAAMRFLLAAQKQNTRKMRLEQLILLAVRTLLVLCVLGAMASVTSWAEDLWRRFWPEGGGPDRAQRGRIHKIVVLDGSLSMAVKTPDGKTCFERARELALGIVRDAAPGDGFNVVLMQDAPLWIVAETALEAGKVAKELAAVQQAHGNADVLGTLNLISAKLNESGQRFDSREVYFLTDLQRSTWAPAAQPDAKKEAKARHESVLQEIQKRARTIFVDVGREVAGNVAVTDVTLGDTILTTGTVVPILAAVQNYGLEPRPKQRVELHIGRARSQASDPAFALRKVAEELVSLKPGDRAGVTFLHKFNVPGTYAIQVRVPEDELAVDDSRTVVVSVKDTLPVLLVDGKAAAVNRFERAAEYLRFALNPYPRGAEPRTAPIRPEVVSLSDFADPHHKKSNLAAYDCVFLCDVGQFQSSEVRRLETHLRRGGGVVFCTGERVAEHLESYNRLLYKNGRGILPAQLVGLPEVPKNVYFTLHAPEEAFREPPLKAFADADDRLTLRTPRFRQYVRAKLTPDGKIRRILSFTPEQELDAKQPDAPPKKIAQPLPVDDPAIVEWNPPLPLREKGAEMDGQRVPTRYRGKVILVTTSVNLDWNNWAGSPSFGALMQELFRVAVAGKLREHSLIVGQILEEYLDTTTPELKVTLYLPGRDNAPVKARTQGADDVAVFRYAATEQSGIYRFTVGSDATEYLFAVNVPTTTPDQRASESDLTRLTKDQLKSAYPGWDFQVVTRLGEIQHGGTGTTEEGAVGLAPIGPAIAHVLLWAVLVLLLLEVVLAWQFGHYSAAVGVTPPPRGTGVWAGAIAGVALVIFSLVAVTLINAAQTGDFLGYLPGVWRATVEGWLDVPPPAPGENSVWHLEFLPFLRSASHDPWFAAGIGLFALVLVALIYRRETSTAGTPYKFLLGTLRICLIFLTLTVLLPQIQLRFERRGWPEIVLLIDDSLSMNHKADIYSDEEVLKAVDHFAQKIKKRTQEQLTEQLRQLREQRSQVERAEVAALDRQIKTLEGQHENVQSPSWRPTRLQLAQFLLTREDPDWLNVLLTRRQMKVHLFHLDNAGRLVKLKDAKGNGVEVVDPGDASQPRRAREALGALVPHSQDSRLGTAVRQVLDYYRGSSLAAVVLLTDGATTRDETLGQVSDYAAQKGVPLFFVGIGDDHEIRELKLEDVQYENTVYVNDRVLFEARVSGRGHKDMAVPVVLKLREKVGKEPDGKDKFVEKELMRKTVRIGAQAKIHKVTLHDQPTETGKRTYIVELDVPKRDSEDRVANPADLRRRCDVFVQDAKQIKVLFIEGTPRYEFRYVKYLLEREQLDKKNQRSIELKVLLVDADDNFPEQDKTALADFPVNKQELNQYDVIILGDVDPNSPKLGPQRLRELADFVRERGGGLLLVAGGLYNPHAYKNTPLAAILPIELTGQQPPEQDRTEGYRPEPTPAGRLNPIFRFARDDAENLAVWQRLTPIYWHAEGYRPKPLAEVLLVHPKVQAEGKPAPGEDRHALVVQQFVGAGRCMFFGFDESWRWRFREDELRFNQFWIQTVRYLARTRLSYTDLRLDRQTDYRVGEPIKVTVRFPDNTPIPGLDPSGKGPKAEVRVMVEYKPPPDSEDAGATEIHSLQLAKVEGSWGTYENHLVRTREGEYRFWLSTPDVSKLQPDGVPPEAKTRVRQPYSELELLRMNQEEMRLAAEATQGQFCTLATADKLLDELPEGTRVVVHTPVPPQPLWNHLFCFVLVLLLVGSEWILRKRKHLL